MEPFRRKKSIRTKINRNGQIILPRTIREMLDIDSGDLIEFWVSDDGQLCLIPIKNSISQLKGILAYSGSKKTIEEMQEAIEKGGETT